MNHPIIETHNLGKKYMIHSSPKDLGKSGHFITKFFNRKTEKWSLRGLNIQVMKGDIVALIGKNGSGKTTLFRLLGEITDPTEGEIVLRGKVTCMLEAGVGFHSELTGKENIYLNGALLGMTKKEIDSQYNKIVAFSELENFLNVPIKKYSSGMYVRLAFSVASFLRTEILLLDEVLSMADEVFRQKAFNRIKEMSNEGCTILMVSHDRHILRSLCKSAIHIESGKLLNQGSMKDVLADY